MTRRLTRRGGTLVLAAGLSLGALAAPAPIAAATDASNACSTATAIPTTNVAADTIGGATDVDWWQFTVASSGGYTRLALVNLPQNYQMALYGSCTSPAIATSARPGKAFEEIIRGLAAGTYRVKVWGATATDFSGTSYSLRRTGYAGGALRLMESRAIGPKGAASMRVVGRVINTSNTARTVATVLVTYDAAGYVLTTSKDNHLESIAPGAAMEFEHEAPSTSGWDSYTVYVTPFTPPYPIVPAASFPLSNSGYHVDSSGAYVYTGDVTNKYGSQVREIHVYVAVYSNTTGSLTNMRRGIVGGWIAPGEVASYSVTFPAGEPGTGFVVRRVPHVYYD